MAGEKRLVLQKMMQPRSVDSEATIRNKNLGDGTDASKPAGPAGSSQGSNKLRPYPRAARGRDFRPVKLGRSFGLLTNGEILPPEALLEQTHEPVVRTRVVVRVSKKPDPSEVLALRQVGKDKVKVIGGSGAKKKPADLPKEIVVDLSKAYGQVTAPLLAQEDLDLATHLHVLSMIPQGLRDARGNPTGLAKSLHAAGVLTKREAFAKAQRLLKGLV